MSIGMLLGCPMLMMLLKCRMHCGCAPCVEWMTNGYYSLLVADFDGVVEEKECQDG